MVKVVNKEKNRTVIEKSAMLGKLDPFKQNVGI